MTAAANPDFAPNSHGSAASTDSGNAVVRINSRDLFQHGSEIEIDHEGRIYRLRLTQFNKLILNA